MGHIEYAGSFFFALSDGNLVDLLSLTLIRLTTKTIAIFYCPM